MQVGDLIAINLQEICHGIVVDEDYKAIYVKFHDEHRLGRFLKEEMETREIKWEVISESR